MDTKQQVATCRAGDEMPKGYQRAESRGWLHRWAIPAGVVAATLFSLCAHAQTNPQRSYIVCSIHEVMGPPERRQAFVIDDKLKSVDGISGSAVSTFTSEKIVWRDESFETTLDRVAGFITINILTSGDLYSSGPCARADGPKF
jgi:hypothetical protein